MNRKILFLLIIQVAFCLESVFSQTTHLFPPFNLTYNEANYSAGTAAIDISAQNQNIPINSITLNYFDVGSANTATIGVRIYSLNAQFTNTALVLSQTTTTSNVHNAALTLPINFLLQNNVTYRIGFYLESQNSDHFFKSFQTSATSYYDSNVGFIKILHNEGYYAQFDVFPTSGLYPMPYISLGINTTGIKENTNLIGINLYPNPATDILNICFRLTENDLKKVEILNNLGQIIREEEIVFKNKRAFIKTNDLPNGVYLLNLKSTNSLSVSKRFVIAR